jgi:hypothetical protein
MTIDGLDQREATDLDRELLGMSRSELADRIAAEARDVESLKPSELTLARDINHLGTTALAIKAQRDLLADTLRDLAMGAEIMLEPVMGATGTFKQFAEEVRRVAKAGLKEAAL